MCVTNYPAKSTLQTFRRTFYTRNRMNLIKPQIPADLTSLENLMDVLEAEDDISEALIDTQFGTGAEARGISITESSIVKSDISAMTMENFDIANVTIKNSNLSGSKFPESNWRAVEIKGSRCSGLDVQNSMLKNVQFSNSKLDIVNFRFSKIEGMIFKDCVLDDVDFYGATLKNVEFIDCTISKITFAAAKMHNVDLSKSTIEAVQGIASLKGAIINYDQLTQLAPYFAAEAGIKVL